MVKGFYNLTSGMLTQQRNLNVVGNNMVNISTAGYKQDQYVASTFDEVMYSRVSKTDKSGGTEIGRQSYLRATDQVYADFSQGVLEPTGIALDFAIQGDGFFAIERGDGSRAYTRNGNFSLDDEGYLCLSEYGRVLDAQGEALQLLTDKLQGDESGNITAEDGRYLGKVGVFVFADNAQLQRDAQGFFTGGQAQAADAARVFNGYTERANVDMIGQMTQMMTCQRALQSAAQVTKLYDQLITKAATEIGRL